MSLSNSEVSVITVNWNGRGHLETLLPSLAVVQAGEVIVVDNGSTDDSVDWVHRSYPDFAILRNQRNLGFAPACNLAARSARGRILAFINNDMRCDPDWIAAALPGLSRSACVASRILDWEGRSIDYNGASLQYLGYATQMDIGRPAADAVDRGQVLFPCGGAMFIHRDVFLKLGGFDEGYFAIFEDVDLGWRLWISGHDVRMAADSRVFHRGHATFRAQSLPKTRYLMHRNALFTIVKNYEEEHFRKIVPLAVLLALKRAIRCSGVNREAFYLWKETSMRALDPAEPAALEGMLDALNHLVAIDDLIDELPRLLQKRRAVQALRRRPDRDIFTLFQDPLRPIVLDAEYMQSELDLIRCLRLDEVFACEDFQRALESAPSRASERLRSAREELFRLQHAGLEALTHTPPPTPKPKTAVGRFLRSCRNEGLRTALDRAWRSLRAL